VKSQGTPRSTLDDIIRDLEQAGLVEYEDGLWHPTYLGRVAYRVHCNYLDHLESLSETSPVLEDMDTNSGVCWEFLNGADAYETHPSVQDGVLTELLEYAEEASDIRVATPQVVAGYGDRFYQRGVINEDYSLEIIIPPEVHQWFHSTHSSITADVSTDSNVIVFCASIPFHFGLAIFDDKYATVTVFTDQGIAGLLVNDTNDALSWAENQFKRAKQDAEPISLD